MDDIKVLLTLPENELVYWARSLNSIERLAVRCFLFRGDDRLISHIRPNSKNLQRFLYLATPVGSDELRLIV